jgi:CxxC-x17-CxxC domain-containing protein
MKKKSVGINDVPALMAQIQAQLAVLDRKLDAFMTKSLTELAEAKAAVEKKAQHVPSHAPTVNQGSRPSDRPARQMYAVVCYDCGKDTEIPFKPSGDRPVYCQECFAKRRTGQGPKPAAFKPSSAPSIQPKEPAPVAAPAASKKKAVAKKAVAKKKTVVKKQPKRK